MTYGFSLLLSYRLPENYNYKRQEVKLFYMHCTKLDSYEWVYHHVTLLVTNKKQ